MLVDNSAVVCQALMEVLNVKPDIEVIAGVIDPIFAMEHMKQQWPDVIILHDSGAITLAQDKETSVVYGMPKEAIKHGGVQKELALQEIPNAIISFSKTD